tara:strand:+ start:22457 stop:22927 length:471 start_codon:yes stop_codon:yes gene_type:complete
MLNEPKWDVVFELVSIINEFKKNLDKSNDLNLDNIILDTRISINKKIHLNKKYFNYNDDFFKLVIFYVDETISKYLNKNYKKWSLLQLEYFSVNNGGQLFFDVLDNSLLKLIDDNIFTIKTGYFLLKHGFVGKFYDSQQDIMKYSSKLEEILINWS